MTPIYILCANEKKDQSEIGKGLERANFSSAVTHCRYLLPFMKLSVERTVLLDTIIA